MCVVCTTPREGFSEMRFRMSRSWMAVAALTGATVAVGTTAHADTYIGPPIISPTTYFFYPGVAAQFTFTEGGDTATAFQYSVNGGPTQTVAAVDDKAQVTITPTGRVTNVEVSAVAADGTVGASTTYTALAEAQTPESDEDLNGDGVPDLVTIGGTPGLASGIWQALGTGDTGKVVAPATDITGIAVPDEPTSYFDGRQVVVGHYSYEGFQDLFVYNPNTGGGLILPGSGDGSALNYEGVTVVDSGWLADPITGDKPLRITGGLDASKVGNGHDGLFAITGDSTHGYALDYDEPMYIGFTPLQITGTTTPDGTADWNEWTLATAQTATGIDMFLWNQTTGGLYLWTGVTVTDNSDWTTATLSYTQYQLSDDWNKGKPLTTLEAADFGGAATAGLWTVSPDGLVTSYVVRDLSAVQHTGQLHRTHERHLS